MWTKQFSDALWLGMACKQCNKWRMCCSVTLQLLVLTYTPLDINLWLFVLFVPLLRASRVVTASKGPELLSLLMMECMERDENSLWPHDFLAKSGWRLSWLHLPQSDRLTGPHRSEEKTSCDPCLCVFLSSELLTGVFRAGNLPLFTLRSKHLWICPGLISCLWGGVSADSIKVMEMWTKGRSASSELLRPKLGSLSDFSSDFSQIIQLFFHTVSVSSRSPSGGRNPGTQPTSQLDCEEFIPEQHFVGIDF